MTRECELPKNMWGLVVGALLCSLTSREHATLFPAYVGMLATIALQASFVFYIQKVTLQADIECAPLEGILWPCAFVFIGNIFHSELDEAFDICAYQWQFGTGKPVGGIQYEEKTKFVRSKIWRRTRVLIVLLLCAKVAISILLMHYGMGFLAQSSSQEELLLNSAAMLFVVEVDELVYNVMVSRMHKKFVEQMPSISLGSSEIFDGVVVCGAFAKVFSCVFIVVMLRWVWCSSGLPSYVAPAVSMAFVGCAPLVGVLVSISYWLLLFVLSCVWRDV